MRDLPPPTPTDCNRTRSVKKSTRFAGPLLVEPTQATLTMRRSAAWTQEEAEADQASDQHRHVVPAHKQCSPAQQGDRQGKNERKRQQTDENCGPRPPSRTASTAPSGARDCVHGAGEAGTGRAFISTLPDGVRGSASTNGQSRSQSDTKAIGWAARVDQDIFSDRGPRDCDGDGVIGAVGCSHRDVAQSIASSIARNFSPGVAIHPGQRLAAVVLYGVSPETSELARSVVLRPCWRSFLFDSPAAVG